MDRGRQNLGGGSWNPHVSSFICYPHLHPSPASVSPAGPPCGGGEGSESRQLGHFLLFPQLIRGRRQDPVGCLRWHLPRPRLKGITGEERDRQTATRGVVPAWQKACELVWAVGGATGLQLCLPRGLVLAVPCLGGHPHHLSPPKPRVSLGH